jgi:hypothetical protein
VYRALLENGKEALVDLFLDPDGEHGSGRCSEAKAWHKKYSLLPAAYGRRQALIAC